MKEVMKKKLQKQTIKNIILLAAALK